MKQGYKIAIGSLILASALIACGKKGGSAAAPAASATGYGCTVNAQGVCVGATGGFLGIGDGKARVVVSNVAKFQQLLLDNGMCSGPMNIAIYPPNYRRTGLPCNMASNYFDIQIQSVDNDPLPKPINFDVRTFIAGRRVDLAGSRMTQADIYGLSNGYQVIFNRMQGTGYGYGAPYYRPGYRPGYPVPIQTVPAATTNTITVVMTASDATRTIFNVVVSYQGVQIGTGTFYGAFQSGQLAYGNGTAPVTAPYQRQPYDPYYNAK